MILGHGDRFAWIGQMGAVAALSVGAFALARRVGLGPRAGLMSALLVPTLPVVATQAATGYNDLILAAFVVAALVFALGRDRSELVLLGMAVTLATGTKVTAPFVLPVAVIIGMLGQPARRWAAVLGSIGVGAAAGAGWYVVNSSAPETWAAASTSWAHRSRSGRSRASRSRSSGSSSTPSSFLAARGGAIPRTSLSAPASRSWERSSRWSAEGVAPRSSSPVSRSRRPRCWSP